tara:strand:- start:2892 stop:3512 length:621 start_codon:yes stop_codon:yes gene_type:complete
MEEEKEEVKEESEEISKEEEKESDTEGDESEEVSEDKMGESSEESSEKIEDESEEKKGSVKKVHYIIAGIVLVIVVFAYAGSSPTGNVVIENHLEGICDDPEGEVNDFYEMNMVWAGSDETGRVGFTDVCASSLYDGRLDEIGLLFYLNNIAKYVYFDVDMSKDPNMLLEGYCPESLTQNYEEVDPFMLIATYKCPNGCEDGVCIS